MNARVNPFADLGSEPPVFTPKAKPAAAVAEETVAHISEQTNFPSRQAPKPAKEPRRLRRTYTTGRNRQFNIKATAETVDRFYKLADERKVPLCELLEIALDALERAGDDVSV